VTNADKHVETFKHCVICIAIMIYQTEIYEVVFLEMNVNKNLFLNKKAVFTPLSKHLRWQAMYEPPFSHQQAA